MPTATSAEDDRRLLTSGEIEVEGRLTDASNLVLRVWLTDGDRRIPAVYKPIRGERPLWDFPDGSLAGRELATYLIACAGGWSCIPATVVRTDGPMGPGSVQRWVGPLSVGEDPDLLRVDPVGAVPEGYLPVLGLHDEDDGTLAVSHQDSAALREIALLDIVVNNADRKGSALIVQDGRVYAVDHGLTMHEQDKLRTVLWGFAGTPLTATEQDRLHRLAQADLPALLAGVLTTAEVQALQSRLAALTAAGHFPAPPDDRHPLPWPLW